MGAAVGNGPAVMDAEAFVRGFERGWGSPGSAEEAAARFDELLDPDIRLIQPQLPDLVGRSAARSGFFEPLFTLLPDARATVERWAARDDTLFIELTMSGTLGGRPASFRACDRITLRGPVAVERESYIDPIPLLATVAARPRAWPAFARYQLALLRHRRQRRRSR
ncbi:MAG TPA: nuclear transport factor 2 family protein [Solirubrobacterales bacterium]|nr:nuclear transport factor 2 family protein [Solirubrobacterales bacterium]